MRPLFNGRPVLRASSGIAAPLVAVSLAGMLLVGIAAQFVDRLDADMNIVVGPWSSTPSPAPRPDILVFGEYGVVLGGGSTANGLVGARHNNDDNPNAAPPAVYPQQPAYSIQLVGGSTIDADARAGGDAHADNSVTITGTLYYVGSFSHGSGFSGTTVHVADPALPIGPLLSESVWPGGLGTNCPTGGANHTGLPNSFSLTLTPGSHGAIQGGGAGDLTLSGAGDYYITSIVAGNGLTIHIPTPGVRLFVCEKIQLGSGVDVLPTSLGPTDFITEVAGINVTAGTNAFTAAAGSHWIGDLLVPTRGAHYGGSSGPTTWNGHLWADHVDIEHGVTIFRTVAAPAPQASATPTASATAAPTASAAATATAAATPSPTAAPSATAPASPSPNPTATP